MNKIILSVMVISGGLYCLFLSGCANVALAATDPRSISTTTNDQYTKRQLSIIYAGKEFESDHISVDMYDNDVLLTGQAVNWWQKNKAVQVAKDTKGVNKVFDYVEVSSSYVSTTTNDTLITAKVKSSLLGASDINSNDVQVITTNSVVYIFGIIEKSQLNSIIDIAKGVDGVKEVVPLFKYKSSDSKLNLPT